MGGCTGTVGIGFYQKYTNKENNVNNIRVLDALLLTIIVICRNTSKPRTNFWSFHHML